MRAKIRLTLLGLAVAAFAVAALVPQAAIARPDYKDGFEKLYKDKVGKVDCNICHDKKNPKNKKMRNEYGKVVGKALGGKTDDADKIEAALKKAAEEKSKSGKTYGEIIESGKRPGG